MVRKRSRRQDSDDNDSDSDVDFNVEAHTRSPAAKKYSLRERKSNSSAITDFAYYGLDDDDVEERRQSSDEDFEVEDECYVSAPVATYYEPDTSADHSNPDGLIDFEDIIRADIVMNKNKIDYDNVIEKSEIKLTQPAPKKRGRKPKNQQNLESPDKEADNEISAGDDLVEPENEDELNKTEIEDTENKATEALQPEIKICEPENGDNIETCLNNGKSPGQTQEENIVEPKADLSTDLGSSLVENKKDMTEEDDDDDVIVLGELKHDVIVLDD